MTYAAFLQALEQTPRDWRLLQLGEIRRLTEDRVPQCPISACYGVGASAWEHAARRIGLQAMLAKDVAFVADNKSAVKPGDIAMRADLLRACGLSEP